jgi:hypothetical protein
MIPTNWKRRRRATPKQLAKAKRRRLLSAAITPYQVDMFASHLMRYITRRGGECWLYGGIREGCYIVSTAKYPTMTVNGVHGVRAYRFALAAHMGVSLLDLEGSDVHHESPDQTGLLYQVEC